MARSKKTIEVDDSVHPFFGADTGELVALRKLADVIEEDETPMDELQEMVAVIRKIQKKKHAN